MKLLSEGSYEEFEEPSAKSSLLTCKAAAMCDVSFAAVGKVVQLPPFEAVSGWGSRQTYIAISAASEASISSASWSASSRVLVLLLLSCKRRSFLSKESRNWLGPSYSRVSQESLG